MNEDERNNSVPAFFNNICKQLLANWLKLIFNSEGTSCRGSFLVDWKVVTHNAFGLCAHVGLGAGVLPLDGFKQKWSLGMLQTLQRAFR